MVLHKWFLFRSKDDRWKEGKEGEFCKLLRPGDKDKIREAEDGS